MFDSRKTWNVIYIARSNPWDAKRNGTTTCMFDSPNTWHVVYISRSNPWDGTHNGNTTFMFDSPNTWKVIYIARSNRSHPPTSPNIPLAMKSETPKAKNCLENGINVIYIARNNGNTVQYHQILRLPRNMILQNIKEIFGKRLERHLQ